MLPPGPVEFAGLETPLGRGGGAGMIGWCLHVQGCREITEDTFYLEQTHDHTSNQKLLQKTANIP
jgi:hypothetical protein